MTSSAPKLLVMAGEKFACVKIIGRANFTSSVDFRNLINELRARGISYFVLDLSECALMDSTFLGVLAGFGLKMGGTQSDPRSRQIELYNANPRITDLLENLGVLQLFRVAAGELELPNPSGHLEAVPPGSHTKAAIAEACLEAHQTLMEIHPGNVAKFKDVAQFFAEDIKKLKSEGGTVQ